MRGGRCGGRRLFENDVRFQFTMNLFHRIILLRAVVAVIEEDLSFYFPMRLRAKCLDNINLDTDCFPLKIYYVITIYMKQ